MANGGLVGVPQFLLQQVLHLLFQPYQIGIKCYLMCFSWSILVML